MAIHTTETSSYKTRQFTDRNVAYNTSLKRNIISAYPLVVIYPCAGSASDIEL